MKRVLYINCTVRNDSRTAGLCSAYLKELAGEDVEITELKLSELDLHPYQAEELEKKDKDIADDNFLSSEYDLARQFAQADEIIVSAPYWDAAFPSVLKIYIEHIYVNKITFSYTEDRKRKKMCRAKRLVYVTTAGGFLRRHSSVQIYMEELCAVFGIEDFRFYCARGLDVHPEKTAQILADTLQEMIEDRKKPAARGIPDIQVPEIAEYTVAGLEEDLVSLKERGFEVSSQYYLKQMPGAMADCYVRRTVADMLEKAQALLPVGYRLKIYDGYRPIRIQQALWHHFRKIVVEKNPGLSEQEIDFQTSFFVSKPSLDLKHPSLHNTGGAVDVTLILEDGDDVDMGTSFDSFKDTAWSAYFEKNNSNLDARENRRILYHAMLDAGFTNLPSEWWHYDYGTKFWGYFTGKQPLYEGLGDVLLGRGEKILTQ